MGKSILEEAMEDTKLLKQSAIENAKNVLVEAITPKIREFVETQIGEADDKMELEGMYDEKMDSGGTNTVPSDGSIGEAKDDLDEAKDEEMKEAKDSQDEPEKVEEVVDITKEDIKRAFSEVFAEELKEATVTKGFGDMQNATIKNAGGKGEKGIADEKTGEHNWNDVTPPDAKDWSVKEAFYRKQVKSLATKLTGVQKENVEYKKALSFLKRSLQEVNLFNGKLLYTNKLLQSANLSNKQKIGVIEALDRAQSLREVQLVYKSLSETLKNAGVMGEGRNTTLKGPKASRPAQGSGTSSTLKESVDKENGNDTNQRLQELAGLVS